MASVWVARLRGKRGFESLVAIKMILPEHAGDREFEEMFLNEARIAAAIRHPNVASILDLGEERGILYLVFEWIDGDQLSVLRRTVTEKGRKFPPGIALRIVADACAGLHAAHELCDAEGWPLSIVHRDVSPQNILVSTTGGVKVIDFGIAKALDRASTNTDAGKVKGKAFYVAPEQITSRDIDRRADIWAAGVVLYQLLAERLPFEGDGKLATLSLVASRRPPPPLPPEVPELIAQVVTKALSADPNERFQTAAEMGRALESALARIHGPVTSADVASFINDQLAQRRATRRKTIADALAVSAQERGSHDDDDAEEPLPSRRLARPFALSGENPRFQVAVEEDEVEEAPMPGPSPRRPIASLPSTGLEIPAPPVVAQARRRRRRTRLAVGAAVLAGLVATTAAWLGTAVARPAGAPQMARAAQVAASSPASVTPGFAEVTTPPAASSLAESSAQTAGDAGAEAPTPKRAEPSRRKHDPLEVFGVRK